MTTLLISPRAREHIAAVDQWWRANRLGAPELFVSALEVAFERLAANPFAGPRYLGLAAVPVGSVELRRILIRRCRYHIYYHFDPELDRVEVLAVWHTSRGRGPRLG